MTLIHDTDSDTDGKIIKVEKSLEFDSDIDLKSDNRCERVVASRSKQVLRCYDIRAFRTFIVQFQEFDKVAIEFR